MAATDSGLGLTWSGNSAISPYLHAFTHEYVNNIIHDARNNNAKILSMIPRNTKFVGGKGILERVKFGRNPRQFNGVGDGGHFPDPGQRKVRWYGYRGRQQFGRFIVDGQLIRAMSNGSGDVDPVADDLDGFLDDYEYDRARQLYSDGSGRLCEIGESGPASTTWAGARMQLNQDIATGQRAPGASASGMPQEAPTRRLSPGMRVLIVTAAGLPRCIANVVSVVDSDEVDLEFLAGASGPTISDFSTCVAGDWVVKTGSTANSSNAQMVANSAFRAEPMGLLGIIGYYGPLDGTGPVAEVGSNLAGGSIEATGAGIEAYRWGATDAFSDTNGYYFQGLACNPSGAGWSSDMTFNQGAIYHNAGTLRTPTENLIMRTLSAYEELNSAEIQMFVSSYDVKNTYMETLTGEKRHVNTLDLKGGWNRAIVGPDGVPWGVDRECPHNILLALSLQDAGFQQWVTEELSWASEQGANIWQFLQDQDKYQARTVENCTMGVGVRNRAGFQLKDLEES